MGVVRAGAVILRDESLAAHGFRPEGIAASNNVVWRQRREECTLVARTAAAPVTTASTETVVTPAIDTTGADLLVAITSGLSTLGTLIDNRDNVWTAGPSINAVTNFNPAVCLSYSRTTQVGPGHTFSLINANQGTIHILAFQGSDVNPADESSIARSLWPGVITPRVSNALIVTSVSAAAFYLPTISDEEFTVLDFISHMSGIRLSGVVAYKVQRQVTPINLQWIVSNPFISTSVIMAFRGKKL